MILTFVVRRRADYQVLQILRPPHHPTLTQCRTVRPRKNMAPIALILISLAIVKTEIDGAATESKLNQLLGIFPVQIRTSETKLGASAGNNLNDGAKPQPLRRKYFQAITQTSLEGKKQNDDKSSSAESNQEGGENVIEPLAMVWDDCMETTFRENHEHLVKAQDLEIAVQDYPIEHHKEISSSNTWNKRDAQNYNVSAARDAWLKRYNNLFNSRADERRQQKPEYVPVKKTTSTIMPDVESTNSMNPPTIFTTTITAPTSSNLTITSTDSTTSDLEANVRIIPITREVFHEEIEIENVTDQNIVLSYTEDWFDLKKVKDRSKIRFSSLPQRTTYLIPTLRLDDGFHPFSFMSEFFYLIHPFEFPVGKPTSVHQTNKVLFNNKEIQFIMVFTKCLLLKPLRYLRTILNYTKIS